MRRHRKLTLLCTLLFATGCRTHYAPPETPMPANTVLLSQMMRELSTQPGFTEAMLAQLDSAQKADTRKGPALLTPKLADELRKRILGKDWEGLDRFPGWTMREINPTVRVVGHFAGKDEKLEETSAVHPGATPAEAKQYLDLGPYALDQAQTVSLDKPSTLAGFTTDGIVSQLGAGVTRGDGANNLSPEHAESQRLADVLNRLAANNLGGAKPFSVSISGYPVKGHAGLPPTRDISTSQSAAGLISNLIGYGHTVTVQDARYFANFGHFHYKGQDVMMPFWVNTQLAVPGTGSFFKRARPLLVPVSHAEYEWHIRGPQINADVSYYFGIDGKSEWRTMDTLDQPWVLKRNAHTYTGKDAVEVTRLAGLLTVAYMHQHAARPKLPFGGYYALGVCQDGVSAIEQKMTGKVTLFPNTADASLFNDPRDAEVNALIKAIPKDREGGRPEPERIFGSLPTDDFAKITIPGLSDDLTVSYAAWKAGTLEHTHSLWDFAAMGLFFLSAVVAGLFAAVKSRKFQDQNYTQTPVQRRPPR